MGICHNVTGVTGGGAYRSTCDQVNIPPWGAQSGFPNGTYGVVSAFADGACAQSAQSVTGYQSGSCVAYNGSSVFLQCGVADISIDVTTCADTACSVNCTTTTYSSQVCNAMEGGGSVGVVCLSNFVASGGVAPLVSAFLVFVACLASFFTPAL